MVHDIVLEQGDKCIAWMCFWKDKRYTADVESKVEYVQGTVITELGKLLESIVLILIPIVQK